MASKKPKAELDSTTEAKIKKAARSVFHKNGFAATRTRDIAEEAGINLALLNYYFRSKQKLFDIIMLETLERFIQSFGPAVNNEHTSLEDKVRFISSSYIDLFVKEPEVPLFIMRELRSNPAHLFKYFNPKKIIMNSFFAKQYQETVKKGTAPPVHILHFIMNLIGLTVFPFIARPMLKGMGDLSDGQFNKLMNERKQLIPVWIKVLMKAR
jgi:AcrR family transcriptional regulator